jgi:F-type H+-transporting ATPase subunit a
MRLSPDQIILFFIGPVAINATVFFTWIVMLVLVLGSLAVTRHLSSGVHVSRWQGILEVIVSGMRRQIRVISQDDPDKYLAFIGTLFLFILVSNVMDIVPLYHPPTGSLLTTAALALCSLGAVPVFGIREQGLTKFLRHYVQPTVLMLPFNIIGELSRTLAMAIRLFGNIMSGTMIAAILLGIAPLVFPIFMQVLELIIGVIQAYIFAVLAMVYIASAARTQHARG